MTCVTIYSEPNAEHWEPTVYPRDLLLVFLMVFLMGGLLIPRLALAQQDFERTEAKTAPSHIAPGDSDRSRDALRLVVNREIAAIRSDDDLDAFLIQGDEPKANPLGYLSDVGRKIFLDSLSFGPRGLASFNTSILELELSPVEAYSVLALFGHQEVALQLRFSAESSKTNGAGL